MSVTRKTDVSAKVARVSEVPPGTSKVVFFMQKELAIFNDGGKFYVVENLCPHRKGPLSEGVFENGVVECPWHGARFDLASGRGLKGPHRCNIRAFEASTEGDEVVIRTSSS